VTKTVTSELSAVDAQLLSTILARRKVRSVYQPIVDLDSRAVVGYEALARGPAGTSMERPDSLFTTARSCGRLADLDEACRLSAIAGAERAGLARPWTLFVNTEPETAQEAFQPSASYPGAVTSANGQELPIVMELTERALTANPAELLRLVTRIRSRGWGIALDDVGADRNSMALLPLLRPDVIKLDLRLIQRQPSAEVAEIFSAVNAEAERSGTAILAEGIETEAHLAIARGLGASLGQGWLLGRPGPLPEPVGPFSGSQVTIVDCGDQFLSTTPFAAGAAMRPPRIGQKSLLVEISKQLERQAVRAGQTSVILTGLQDVKFFTPGTRRRYTTMADTAAFVGVIGRGMAANPAPGVRGGALDEADPLGKEWDVSVIGPHYAATLLARDLGDTVPDAERRFEFIFSHDRELAIAVASFLISRIHPSPSFDE